jgi:EAL domain-containing protein (putative c-di-GMP-specific phosphodiesterase class I)
MLIGRPFTHRPEERPAPGRRVRHAAKRDELKLHYQPIVAVESGTVVAAEALVRWDHPRLGLLPPKAFLPQLARPRDADALNFFVLESAIAQARDWQLSGRDMQISVNVSPQWLTPRLAEIVAEELDRWGVPPRLLHVEVTELPDGRPGFERGAAALERLRGLGISVSLDDFGAGESSLTRLIRLPMDTLKVDRSFVSAMDADRRSAGVVRNSIQLAHSFEMDVVAEGVETEEQWHRLRTWRCDLAQGFLLSQPMPPDELMAWLESEAVPLLRRLTASPRPFVDRRVGPADRRRGPADRRGRGRRHSHQSRTHQSP